MAKKFVRGVTCVDDIEKFDKTLTNVNDLISDGQNTYVHTRKGKNESYYNITDSIKQVESSDDLLTITKQDDTVSIANTGLATKEELATKQDSLTAGDWLSLENNTININKQSIISFSAQPIFVPSKDGLPWFDKQRLTINFNCITDSAYVNKGAHSYAIPKGAKVTINPSQGTTRAIVLNTQTNEITTSIYYNTSNVNPDFNDNIVVIGAYRVSNDGTYNWSFPVLTLDNPQHNKHMFPKFGAHRGMCKYAPESTRSAYYLATLYGFDIWECDVRLTLDNVPVVFHDDQINNYATMSDGTEIANTVKISETNYNDLLQYDFGRKKHAYYAGEKIITFNEFCRYMRAYNCVEAHVELKYDVTWTNETVTLINNIAVSERVKDKIVFSSFQPANGIQQLYALDNNVRLEYVMSNLSENETNITDFNTNYSNASELGLSFSATQSNSSGYYMAININNNFKMRCWVVNSNSDFNNMRGLPLDLVLTDGWISVYGLNII